MKMEEKTKQTLNCDFTDLKKPKIDIDINCGVEDKLIISEYLLQIVTQIMHNGTEGIRFFKCSLEKTCEESEEVDELMIVKTFVDKLL